MPKNFACFRFLTFDCAVSCAGKIAGKTQS